jgi:CheY-like chemotaxis protein
MHVHAPEHKSVAYRPRLVLAYADPAHAAQCCRQLRRLGWEVHLTRSGPEARRLARELAPVVVVLDTDLHDESGWLTCAKLRGENPGQRVILVCPAVNADAERLAEHVGAPLLRRDASLINEVHGGVLSTAG